MLYAFSRDCKSNLDPLPGLCAMLLGQLTVMEEHNLHGFGVELKGVKTDFQYNTKHCGASARASSANWMQSGNASSVSSFIRHFTHNLLPFNKPQYSQARSSFPSSLQ